MTEDEAREFIRSEVARQLKDSDRILYVPAVDVLRKDYLQRAVDRAIDKAAQVGPDGREVLRFMLAHFDDPGVVSRPLSWVAAGVSDYREGRIPDRWGNAMRALASVGFVEVHGRGGSQAYSPRVRDWVKDELKAHSPTIEEIEATYQAVLAELAGEVVAV